MVKDIRHRAAREDVFRDDCTRVHEDEGTADAT